MSSDSTDKTPQTPETEHNKEKLRRKMEEDLMYKMLEEERAEKRRKIAEAFHKEQQRNLFKEYEDKLIEDRLKKKGLINIKITLHATKKYNLLKDPSCNPKDTERAIKKLLSSSTSLTIDDIFFDLPTTRNMRVLQGANFYSHISGLIFAMQGNTLVSIEKGVAKTKDDKELESVLKDKLKEKGLSEVTISKHAVERFNQRSEDETMAENPEKAIKKLLANSCQVKYVKHNVVRLLSNNLIAADYYYNSGWVMVIANRIMVTIEKPEKMRFGRDIVKV